MTFGVQLEDDPSFPSKSDVSMLCIGLGASCRQ